MTNERKAPTDIRHESFKRETDAGMKEKKRDAVDTRHRSLMNAPTDPNSPTTRVNIPPGVEPEDMVDPGRSTPGAPPVDNRSGQKTDK